MYFALFDYLLCELDKWTHVGSLSMLTSDYLMFFTFFKLWFFICSLWPAFVPVHDPSRNAYIGIQSMGTVFTRRFEADHIGSQVPVKLMHLEGLYELFLSKFVSFCILMKYLFSLQCPPFSSPNLLANEVFIAFVMLQDAEYQLLYAICSWYCLKYDCMPAFNPKVTWDAAMAEWRCTGQPEIC